MIIKGFNVAGPVIDEETRCIHYHSEQDRIAIKFKCCDTYYPCILCHRETAGHDPVKWERAEYGTRAVLCGTCGAELTIDEYLAHSDACPRCSKSFNPGCSLHHHLYFELGK
jgi:uncharacterized CHY-type Zn-finger protein